MLLFYIHDMDFPNGGPSRFVSGDYVENDLLPGRYRKLLADIEQEICTKPGREDEKLVLVHPTEYTQSLLEIAQKEVHFQRIQTALTTAIDVKKMYAFGLFNALNMSRDGQTRDKDTEKMFVELVNLFCHSHTLGKLQQFIRDIVDAGEALGWLPYGEKDGCPFVPDRYVILYIPSADEFLARDIEGRDISISFINKLAMEMKPRSTVAFMKDRYHAMHMIRAYRMMSLHYASRPLYVTRDKEVKSCENDQQMLDVKIVNQNKVNETLENMISHNLAGVPSKQKYTSTKHNWNNFVQQMSSDIVEKNRTNTELKQKLQEIVKCQKENNESFTPFSKHLDEGVDMAGSNLGVSSLDTTDEENQYEREWLCTSLGGMDGHRTSYARRGQNPDESTKHSTGTTQSFLEKKAKFYQNVIIYEILSTWLRENNIPLAVIPSESNTMNVPRLMEMKSCFSSSLFSMLLAHATDVPLHFVTSDSN